MGWKYRLPLILTLNWHINRKENAFYRMRRAGVAEKYETKESFHFHIPSTVAVWLKMRMGNWSDYYTKVMPRTARLTGFLDKEKLNTPHYKSRSLAELISKAWNKKWVSEKQWMDPYHSYRFICFWGAIHNQVLLIWKGFLAPSHYITKYGCVHSGY